MATGMYIITGFAVLVGVGALVLAWRLVTLFSQEKPQNNQEDES